jgi:intracellular sulfur oxidation DsrE/DsrF family protein
MGNTVAVSGGAFSGKEGSTMKIVHLNLGLLSTLLLLGFATPTYPEEVGEGWEKVVFHIDETANAGWALMLARSYLDDRPQARVVVVAYGPGVDFLLEDAEDKRGNPYDHRVLGLAERGVDFRVCSDAGARSRIRRSRQGVANGGRGDEAPRLPAGGKSVDDERHRSAWLGQVPFLQDDKHRRTILPPNVRESPPPLPPRGLAAPTRDVARVRR